MGRLLRAPELEVAVIRALLSLRMAMTPKKCKQWEEGQLAIKASRMSLRGAPPWRKQATVGANLTEIATAALEKQWPQLLPADFRIKTFFISCHVCQNSIQTAKRTLWSKGKWASIRCAHCNCSRSARKWLCTCGTPWPGCEFHAPMGYECGKNYRKRQAEDILALPPPPSSRTCLPLIAPASATFNRLKRKRDDGGGIRGPSTIEKHQRIVNARANTCQAASAGSIKRPTSREAPSGGKKARCRLTATRRRPTKGNDCHTSAMASIARMRQLRAQEAAGSSSKPSPSVSLPVHGL